MDRYEETFETWNKIAALYEDAFMKLRLYDDTYDFFCENIPLNAQVLDAGCGPGNIAKYLLTIRPDLHVTGIDIAPGMIALAKKNNPSGDFLVMDIRQPDGLKKRYDGIICGFGLPYLSEAECAKFIADSSGLLLDHGLLYLSFVEGDKDKSGFQTGSEGNRLYFYFHRMNVFKVVLDGNGFEIVKTFEIVYKKEDRDPEVHSVVIARKKSK